MLSKYQPNFASLTPTEAQLVAGHVARVTEDESVPTTDGQKLYEHLSASGLSQAQVILAVAPDPSPEAVVALEKLVGKPIVREQPAVAEPRPAAAPRPRGPAVAKSDPRTIVSVAPNPKKVGSASHARYELYQVGMTVSQFVAAGGTTADVKWDVDKGFVVLGDPA